MRDSPRFRHRFDRAMNSPRVLRTRRRRSPRGRDREVPLAPRAIPDEQRQTANMTTQPGLRSSGKTGPETLGGQHPKAWLAQERADPRRLEFLCWAQATRPTFKDRSSVAQQHVMREGPGGLTGRAGALLPRAAEPGPLGTGRLWGEKRDPPGSPSAVMQRWRSGRLGPGAQAAPADSGPDPLGLSSTWLPRADTATKVPAPAR